jgi:hypothetical protein
MFEVGQKLETKKEPFIAEVILRNLNERIYTLMVNGSKVIVNEDAINLLMDKSEDVKLEPISVKLERIVKAEPVEAPVKKPVKKGVK